MATRLLVRPADQSTLTAPESTNAGEKPQSLLEFCIARHLESNPNDEHALAARRAIWEAVVGIPSPRRNKALLASVLNRGSIFGDWVEIAEGRFAEGVCPNDDCRCPTVVGLFVLPWEEQRRLVVSCPRCQVVADVGKGVPLLLQIPSARELLLEGELPPADCAAGVLIWTVDPRAGQIVWWPQDETGRLTRNCPLEIRWPQGLVRVTFAAVYGETYLMLCRLLRPP